MNNIFKKQKVRSSSELERLRHDLTTGGEMVRYSINIPRPIHQRFKEATFHQGLDMKDILLEAILEYLRKSNS